VPQTKVERFAAIYRATEAGELKFVGKPPLATDNVTFFPSGGGGLVSTAADYLRFCQMLLNGGELEGVRILKTETVELMRFPHQQYHREGGAYGFGLHVVTRENKEKNKRSTGSFSGGGLAATNFWVDPEKELIGILMTQILNNRYPFQGEFRRFTYQALIDSE
jgi:CubicO group peptidase (beta-lactamase class C family)